VNYQLHNYKFNKPQKYYILQLQHSK